MPAVVVKVNIGDPDPAQQGLRDQVIPWVSHAPGFVAGIGLVPMTDIRTAYR